MACDEWTKECIDWRYYTHQVAPTEGAHAQEVARQATAARRANPANHTDASDEEYQPSNNSVQRTLVLGTMRGTLIDFLDEFELLNENMPSIGTWCLQNAKPPSTMNEIHVR